MSWKHTSGSETDMCVHDKARELARKKVYRTALIKQRNDMAATRETLGKIEATPQMIRKADLRIMELNNAITGLNDSIFALEKELGTTPDGSTGIHAGTE